MKHALTALLALAGLAAGCARGRQERGGADSEAPRENAAVQATDVVCGTTCPRERALSTTFEGRTYFFCHDRCMAEFQRNPRKYAGDAKGAPGVPENRKPVPQNRDAGAPYQKP